MPAYLLLLCKNDWLRASCSGHERDRDCGLCHRPPKPAGPEGFHEGISHRRGRWDLYCCTGQGRRVRPEQPHPPRRNWLVHPITHSSTGSAMCSNRRAPHRQPSRAVTGVLAMGAIWSRTAPEISLSSSSPSSPHPVHESLPLAAQRVTTPRSPRVSPEAASGTTFRARPTR